MESEPETESEPTPLEFPGGVVPEGLVPGKPNVLLVTIDTLRADHLGFLGYDRPTSPVLDRLAAESVVFERAYAPMATTLPSHTTMFTGVAPHEHGVLANIADGQTYRRAEELLTLTELFKRSGYRTHAVVSAFPLSSRFGLRTGFQGYEEPPTEQRDATSTNEVALRAVEFLARSEKPSFLWVHYFDPHGPYDPPAESLAWFEMEDERLADLRARGFVDEGVRRTGQENRLARGIDAYDGEIRFTDAAIGELLATAESTGWLDGAIVCVLADHGEGLNQHGEPGHGLVWEEQLHVPMLIRAPGLAPRRLPWSVSLADFAPTLLHLIDLRGEKAFLTQVSGIDRFRADVDHGDTVVLGQTSPLRSVDERISYSLRVGDWKLHRNEDGVRRLFDLAHDPDELEDVAAAHGDVVARLEGILDERLRAQRRAVRTEKADRDVASELGELGYGGGDEDDDER